MLCGSDIPALLAHTREMIFLEDGDDRRAQRASGVRIETVLAARRSSARPSASTGAPCRPRTAATSTSCSRRSSSSRDVVEATLRGRDRSRRGRRARRPEMGVTPELAQASSPRSTSSRAARATTPAWPGATGSSSSPGSRASSSSRARCATASRSSSPTIWWSPSASRARPPTRSPRSRRAKAQGAKVLAVCNVVDSAIPRLADGSLYTHAGPEIGVASTKCFTTQLAALLMLAVYLGRRRGTLAAAAGARAPAGALGGRRATCATCSATHDYVHAIAQRWVHAKDVPVPGPRPRLPDRARGRAQAQGDLVRARRGLRRRRDEARADRAHRRGAAGDRRLPARRALRQDVLQPAGGPGARGAGRSRSPRRATSRSSRSLSTTSGCPRCRTRSARCSPCCRCSSSPTTSPT